MPAHVRPRRDRLRTLTSLVLGCALLLPTSASDVRRSAAGAPGCPASGPAVGVPAGSAGRVRADPGAPNIVLILADDFSWNLLARMPEVSKMRRRGVTFTNHFVSDSLCCPSRATILTGRHPHNTGVQGNYPPVGGFEVFRARGHERSTFATALQAKGYRTALMGKYLNGYRPERVGGAPQPYVPPGWDDWAVSGSAGYLQYGYALNENGRVVRYGHAPRDYLTDVLSAKGTAFIGRSVREHRPFLLVLSTFAVHHPYVPARRHAKTFPGLRAPRTPAFDEAVVGDKPTWLRIRRRLTKEQIATADRRYRQRARAALAIDEMVGRIRRQLVASGVAKRTYLVFTSDNGFHLGEHRLLQGKSTAYDPDVRVPLVATGPGLPAGRSVAALTQNTDLSPTFLELGGAAPTSPMDGRSLVPLLRTGTAPNWRGAAFIGHVRPLYSPLDPDAVRRGEADPPSYRAIRTTSELYVEYVDGSREHYDLRRDPYQLVNTIGLLPAAERLRLVRAVAELAGCSGRSCMATSPDPTSAGP